MIQAVTFWSPIVGGHQQPLISGHIFTHHPKKVTIAESPGRQSFLVGFAFRKENKKNTASWSTQKIALNLPWNYHETNQKQRFFFQPSEPVLKKTSKWVFPKIGVFPPKWMVKIMEKPLKKWMIWWSNTIFFETLLNAWRKNWLVVSTHLKNMLVKIRSFLQFCGVKIPKIFEKRHHLVFSCDMCDVWKPPQKGFTQKTLKKKMDDLVEKNHYFWKHP